MTESFVESLQSLLNANSMENGSDTPDYILAEFLCAVLEAWDHAVRAREKWYER